VKSILEVKDLQKNYDDFATVKDISYQNQLIKERGRK
jgi:hypothetical protein